MPDLKFITPHENTIKSMVTLHVFGVARKELKSLEKFVHTENPSLGERKHVLVKNTDI